MIKLKNFRNFTSLPKAQRAFLQASEKIGTQENFDTLKNIGHGVLALAIGNEFFQAAVELNDPKNKDVKEKMLNSIGYQ